MGVRVVVAGASGYAGGELLRLVSGHPGLELLAATAGSSAGTRVGAVHPGLRSAADATFVETTPEVLSDADLVFLALPHGVSAGVARTIPDHVKVVDLGADHRLTDEDSYHRYCRGEYPGAWTYGLPELPGQRAEIATSRRVANTGCYAVAIITALAPLIAAGLIEPEDVVVVAASGTSGAGRDPKPNLLGTEVMGNVTPYKVGAHQHVPEILQASGATSLSFTPLLAPMPRGIVAAVTARPHPGVDGEQARAALQEAYIAEPFVHVLPEGQQPQTAATFGSNAVHLQAVTDLSSGRIVVTSAIDNLGKGAAGQAVQNANIMLGLDEASGLSTDGVAS